MISFDASTHRSMAAMDARRASAVVAAPPLPPAIDEDVSVAEVASRLVRRAAAADCDKREGWW